VDSLVVVDSWWAGEWLQLTGKAGATQRQGAGKMELEEMQQTQMAMRENPVR